MSRSKLIISGNFDRRALGAVHERISNLAALFSSEFKHIDIQGHQSSLLSKLLCCLRIYGQVLFRWAPNSKVLIYGWPLPAITLLPLIVLDRLLARKIIVDVVDWFDLKSNSRIYNLAKNIDTYILKKVCYGLVTRHVLISSKLRAEYPSGKAFVFPQIIRDFVPRAPLRSDMPLTLIYAGYPFPRLEKYVPVENYKDRIDLIIKGVNSAATTTGRPCVLHLAGLTRTMLEYAMPFLNDLTYAQSLQIQFHGEVNQSRLQTLIGQSHYFVLLRDKKKSSDYGFPTKITDSLKLGVPIIYNDTSDLKIYLENTACIECDLSGFQTLIEGFLLKWDHGSYGGIGDFTRNPLAIEMFSTPHLKEFLA